MVTPLRIHYLQHVSFEGLGSIEPHLTARGHELTCIPMYKGAEPHTPEELDWLIVMGGPMSVHDERLHPWLEQEKAFIKAVIAAGKPVLGICLGAQLLAEALGATVSPNEHREIGWFPVAHANSGETSEIAAVFPNDMEVFHWHGDTFSLPAGAISIGSSEACANQGFVWKEQVVALQFHLETTQSNIENLIAHCADELDGSRYVQQPSHMMNHPERFNHINQQMNKLLDVLEAKALTLARAGQHQ